MSFVFERTCDIFQKPIKSHRSPKFSHHKSFTCEVSVSTSVSPASPSPEFSLPNFEGFRKDFRRLRSQPCHPKVWRNGRKGVKGVVNPSKKIWHDNEFMALKRHLRHPNFEQLLVSVYLIHLFRLLAHVILPERFHMNFCRRFTWP